MKSTLKGGKMAERLMNTQVNLSARCQDRGWQLMRSSCIQTAQEWLDREEEKRKSSSSFFLISYHFSLSHLNSLIHIQSTGSTGAIRLEHSGSEESEKFCQLFCCQQTWLAVCMFSYLLLCWQQWTNETLVSFFFQAWIKLLRCRAFKFWK